MADALLLLLLLLLLFFFFFFWRINAFLKLICLKFPHYIYSSVIQSITKLAT